MNRVSNNFSLSNLYALILLTINLPPTGPNDVDDQDEESPILRQITDFIVLDSETGEGCGLSTLYFLDLFFLKLFSFFFALDT